MTKLKNLVLACSIITLLAALPSHSAERGPVIPGPQDKCGVCGMFTAPYAAFLAQVVYKDGAYATFDGPKDMFRYLLDLGKYAKGRTPADIAAIYVTDYYNVRPVEAHKAFFVVGSDVVGPMGHELIPLASEAEAREFQRDHKGKAILRYEEIGARTLHQLGGHR